jgi:oxysterol-binding protein-related protein 9/10/11
VNIRFFKKSEDFVNVNTLSNMRKLVRPIVEQEEFESRRLWRDVTFGLK